MKDECLYLMNHGYCKGYNDGFDDGMHESNETLEKIARLFEEEFIYYDGWALDKWYEIKDILEKEYWKD